VGSVRTFLDQSPFCSLPKDGDNFRPLDYLLQRPVCIDRSSLIVNEEACQTQLEVVGNENTLVTCVWKDFLADSNVNATPSPAPTPASTGKTMAPSNPPANVVHVDIRLEACLCKSSSECITTPLTIDNPLILCVTTSNKDIDGMNIELLSVSHLRLDQGSDSDTNSVIVMDEAGVHVPGARYSCEGSVCQIHCPMLDLTLLFESGQDNLVASGTVLVASPEQRRTLRRERANDTRILSNDGGIPDAASFATNITLATRWSLTENDDNDDELASTSRNLWIVLACFVGLMICCCFGLLKMKSRSSIPYSKNKSAAKQKNKPLKPLREQEQAIDGLE
jgi:hypothetical protein